MPKRKSSFRGRKRKRFKSSRSSMAGGGSRGASKVYKRSPWGKFGDASKAIIRQPSALPDRMFVRLRYSQVVSFTGTAGALTTRVFSGNSVWDPDVTGAGGVAFQAAQWMSTTVSGSLYRNYRVYASRIKVTANQPTSAAGVQIIIYPSPLSTGLVTTSADGARAAPYAKNRNYSYGAFCYPLSAFMTTERIEGRAPGSVEYDNTLAAGYGASPTNQWYWHLGACASDETNTVTATYQVELTYFTEMYLRTRLSGV